MITTDLNGLHRNFLCSFFSLLCVEHDGGPYGQDGIYAVEASRVANSSVRMMDAFQKGALALHKLRTGGKQVVVPST
jgi:hypothetical protein